MYVCIHGHGMRMYSHVHHPNVYTNIHTLILAAGTLNTPDLVRINLKISRLVSLPEIVPEPVDMRQFLLHRHVGIARHAGAHERHEVLHRRVTREVTQVTLEKDVLSEADLLLILQGCGEGAPRARRENGRLYKRRCFLTPLKNFCWDP